MGVHTSTEIEELSLRTPRLVAIYLCESYNYAKVKSTTRYGDKPDI
ncbi:hypothetical protein [Lysinibacillus xylanilyticus]